MRENKREKSNYLENIVCFSLTTLIHLVKPPSSPRLPYVAGSLFKSGNYSIVCIDGIFFLSHKGAA